MSSIFRYVVLPLATWAVWVSTNAAPLNKYQIPSSDFAPQQQVAAPLAASPVVVVPEATTTNQQAPDPSLMDPNSPVYRRPTKIIRELSAEKQAEWLDVYRRKRLDAEQGKRVDEYFYYNTLIRITEGELSNHEGR